MTACVQSLVSEENRIQVDDELRAPHPAVKAPRGRSAGGGTGTDARSDVSNPTTLPITVSKESRDRAMRVMDALVKALEARGYPVTGTGALIEGERVRIAISEKEDRLPHVATAAEEAKQKKSSWERPPAWDYIPSGRLSIHSDSSLWSRPGLRKRWSDTKFRRLEDSMNEVLLGLVALGAGMAQRTEEDRLQRERWAEQARQQKERERLERVAAAREKDILASAKSFAEADIIRRFIDAVRQRAEVQGELVAGELAWKIHQGGRKASAL